ncbi:MAG TPA: DUF3052 domain-containing protein [Actinomycetota bacterium]|nr:DUF3052 domain-containing protein [Actinomycetota bacterium]
MGPDKDYSATPLWKKLGLKPGHRISISSAPYPPVRFDPRPLVDGFRVVTEATDADVQLFFTTSRETLERVFGSRAGRLPPHGGLWIAWPKKKSSLNEELGNDLDFDTVQRIGLAAGLVDNKSCSIDEDWQALRFVYRVEDRPNGGR